MLGVVIYNQINPAYSKRILVNLCKYPMHKSLGNRAFVQKHTQLKTIIELYLITHLNEI